MANNNNNRVNIWCRTASNSYWGWIVYVNGATRIRSNIAPDVWILQNV